MFFVCVGRSKLTEFIAKRVSGLPWKMASSKVERKGNGKSFYIANPHWSMDRKIPHVTGFSS